MCCYQNPTKWKDLRMSTSTCGRAPMAQKYTGVARTLIFLAGPEKGRAYLLSILPGVPKMQQTAHPSGPSSALSFGRATFQKGAHGLHWPIPPDPQGVPLIVSHS